MTKDGQQFDEQYAQSLRNQGLDPNLKIHHFYGCFSFEEVQRSLFDSTRSRVVPVYLSNEDEGVRIPVVIDLARPLYLPQDIGDEDAPNWYFEGWIMKTGFDATRGVERVRIHVSTLDPHDFTHDDRFMWQRIPSA